MNTAIDKAVKVGHVGMARQAAEVNMFIAKNRLLNEFTSKGWDGKLLFRHTLRGSFNVYLGFVL